MKIVRAIRNGWIKPKKSETDKPRYYMIWDQDDTQVCMTSCLDDVTSLADIIIRMISMFDRNLIKKISYMCLLILEEVIAIQHAYSCSQNEITRCSFRYSFIVFSRAIPLLFIAISLHLRSRRIIQSAS